ncbi:uncharacterized protein LOC107045300 [Diachasma alloeum]|uniref:uncharacterized protein LOC107045300 n=1 Tax=Diachasma alloeum TaxID=454923 RepID=UPI00073837A1|nr:uncharacterized protein LOC107045300 [Diachasma alloeum]
MEIEQDGWLPFLDVLIRCNQDDTLSHEVYRKPTHTYGYLNTTFHYDPSQKNSVISSLMYGALTISQPSKISSEVENLATARTTNGYSIQQIRKIKQKLRSKLSSFQEETIPEENQERLEVALLPYLRGTTDRISKVLGKHIRYMT